MGLVSPAPKNMLLRCSGCAQLLRVGYEHAGKKMSCPKCPCITAIPSREFLEHGANSPPVGQPPVPESVSPLPLLAVVSNDSASARSATEHDVNAVDPYPGFRLVVDHEELTAVLIAEIGSPPIQSKAQLKGAFRDNGISHGIDANQINLAFLFLGIEEDFQDGQTFVVARGTHPVHGEDGQIVLTIDVSGQAKFSVDGELNRRSVDFKEATRIEVVEQGQLLAKIIPPSRGKAGIDLAGQRIPAKCGEVKNLQAGDGVSLSDDGLLFNATTQGRPILEKGSLSVAEIYEVEGNVDYSTGNIRFNGHVTVKGNVLDDFEIECRSLEIHGTVGSARIVCDNDAMFLGGINGQGKGTLTIGGHCTAKYLNQVTAQVDGNIAVERGITNCLVRCLGEVAAERIVGGHSFALLGFELNYLGSDLGVTTLVVPGQDYRTEMLTERLTQIDDETERLAPKAEAWQRQTPELDRLSSEAKEAYKQAYELTEALQAERLELRAKKLQLASRSLQSVEVVNIGNQICNDVIVSNGVQSREFKQTFSGKCSICPDPETGYFEIGPYKRRLVNPELRKGETNTDP